MQINLSEHIPYYTQRNNKFYPNGTCNTTAMIQALDASGISYNYPKDMQPEDYLTQLLDSKDAWNRMRKLYPWAIAQGYSPRHVHEMLAWAVNDLLVGKKVVEFRQNISIRKICLSLLRGSAVVVAGRFTKFGHIVCVVGLSYTGEIASQNEENIKYENINYMIVDDPYGNWHTGYTDVRGNDITFSFNLFNSLTKNYYNPENKLAHIFGGVV